MSGKLADILNSASGRCGRFLRQLSSVPGRFRTSQRGNVVVLTGLALPILIGFTGLAVEVNYWYLEKRKMQEAVDSAAIAAACPG